MHKKEREKETGKLGFSDHYIWSCIHVDIGDLIRKCTKFKHNFLMMIQQTSHDTLAINYTESPHKCNNSRHDLTFEKYRFCTLRI